MDRIKPARWSPSPGLVTPQYRHFWRDLTFAVDLNYNDTDLIHGAQPELRNGEWKSSTVGTGWDVTAGTTDKLHWPMHPDYYLVGDVEHSVFVSLKTPTSSPAAALTFMGLRGSTANGCWLLYHSSGDAIIFSFRDSGGIWRAWASGPDVPFDGGHHTIGFVRQVGGVGTYYLDGVPSEVAANTSTPIAPASDTPFTLGGTSAASTEGCAGIYTSCYVWQNRALTDADMLQLHRDPFGPLRPAGTLVYTPGVIDLVYQYAYPTSDISSTDWDTAPTASQSLYAQIDEETRSDTDYIFYSP